MMQVNFLDVGQGDSTFIRFPNGTTMLIDCKINDEGFFTWFDDLLPLNEDEEKRVLDYIVITHPHKDHIQGIGMLKDRYIINNIWESGHRLYVPKEDKDKYPHYYAMLDLIQKVKKNGGEHLKLEAYNDVELPDEPDVGVLVLSPTKAYLEDEKPTERDIHDQCAVLRIAYAGRSILFTGDSSMEAWKERIVPYYSDDSGMPNLIKSTVLHASHHCSYTFFKPKGKKDDEPFIDALEKIEPEITIISVGEQNNHGHPDDDALNKYLEKTTHEQVMMTKDHGTINMEVYDNGDYNIYTENMRTSENRYTIGSIKIATSPAPKENGKYNKEAVLDFRANFTKLPKGQGVKQYKWIVQNNGIGDDGSHHEWYVGQEKSLSTYSNFTAYEGTHTLLCEVRNQKGSLIATHSIKVIVE
ncbi:ComEC/Rec2 family competence protein [Tumebacillus avium]|nr:MBL fold metallo-hydrolase [Tumebacillus avium]